MNLDGQLQEIIEELLAHGISLDLATKEMLLEECPDFWWYVKYNIEAVSNDLQGYVQSFTGRRMFLKQAWLNE